MRGSLYRVEKKTYTSLQPRFSTGYALNDATTIKASYTHVSQYLHLLTNSSLGQPTDLCFYQKYFSTKRYSVYNRHSPGNATANVLGHAGRLLQTDSEIEYADETNFLYERGETWEDKVISGDGEAYGVELFIQKKTGTWTGWVRSTLSWANRWFDAIDQGNKFPFTYDRRHDISLLIGYQLPKERTLSAAFVFSTGNVVTLATGRYQGIVPGNWDFSTFYDNGFWDRNYISNRDNYRMPAYHRLDISYQAEKTKLKERHRTWIFSLYNAYNRLNPYFLDESNGTLKKYTLFPIIPSIAYRLEF